jgi:hypothetical protein
MITNPNSEDPFSDIFEYYRYQYPTKLYYRETKWVELSPRENINFLLLLPNYKSTYIIPTKE